ncbi:fatty acid desaturase-domain-containing protein [Ganoderma leucocontextum]|nr:fatty acid desaturase-domain-containing protein [Ganoderma leucocontextum]
MGDSMMSTAATPTSREGKTSQTSPDDDLPEFTPMPWKLREIRAAIPSRLFIRDTRRGLAWLGLDLLMAAVCWKLALYIDPTFRSRGAAKLLTPLGAAAARWACWTVYWWFQGLIFTGIWVIGHECGHGAFSASQYVCDLIGFTVHTLLWTPYFSWKISHHRHHCNHASMERDEVYVPKTRSDLGIPEESDHGKIDYDEFFGDTPIYTLYTLVRQQLFAFPAYLFVNVSGQKKYPKWTNHFDPNSILFTKEQWRVVMMSNLGILSMVAIVRLACITWGAASVIKLYGIPWLCVTHWFIMITYLHHTDPELPHYRQPEWNFQRGAAATVDRDFLGWMGRFFLHDVAHYHVVHHFFPKMPFYHGEEATQYLQAFIGEHYHRSEKPVFKALWDNYNDCQFVEDTGDVLFYRDKQGQAVLRPAAKYLKETEGEATKTSEAQ